MKKPHQNMYQNYEQAPPEVYVPEQWPNTT